jgi:transcriptional regulator with XRE-family HTH domain
VDAKTINPRKGSQLVIGERLRTARKARALSMQAVADKAQISVATLSRIETDKQGVDLDLFLQLAKILGCSAAEMLDGDTGGGKMTEQLAERIAALPPADRTRLWRKLATESREKKSNSRATKVRHLATQVEELLAQIEFVRAEMESVRKRLRR